MNTNYSIIIQWSEKDNCFIAMLPEWGKEYHTTGDSYEETLKNAKETIALLIKNALSEGEALPEPHCFKIPSPIK